MKTIAVSYYNPQADEEYEVQVPVRWVICDRCQGEGRHVHEALGVWTGSDREEDPEGFAAMMSGAYDVSCRECEGRGRVLSPLESATDEEHEAWSQSRRSQGPCPIQLAEMRCGA